MNSGKNEQIWSIADTLSIISSTYRFINDEHFQKSNCKENICYLPTPVAGGQEKSCAEQMNFLGLWPGGWASYFWHQFRFSLCYPKDPTRRVTVGGNYPLQGLNSIFHFAIPRRLIRWVTVGGQLPTSGAKFNFPLCYPKRAHSLGHRWG